MPLLLDLYLFLQSCFCDVVNMKACSFVDPRIYTKFYFSSLFCEAVYFKRRCFECGCLYFCQISEWAHLKTPTLMCICTELCYFQTFLHQKRKWFHLYALRKEMSNRIKWQFSTIHHVAWNLAISQSVFQPSSLIKDCSGLPVCI